MANKRRVPERLRQQVRQRAGDCCEYCLIHEDDAYFAYEADHVIAEKHGGAATLDNLAWACASCNRYKGTDLAAIDPQTNHITPIFNPRNQQWRRHFRLNGAQIDGLTTAGRATVRLLHLNDNWHVDERAALIQVGRYPPQR